MRGNLASRINSQINSIGSAKMNMASRIYWTARTIAKRRQCLRGKAAFPSRVERDACTRSNEISISSFRFRWLSYFSRRLSLSFFFFSRNWKRRGQMWQERRDASRVHWILSSSFRSSRLIKTTFILFFLLSSFLFNWLVTCITLCVWFIASRLDTFL